MIKKSNIPTFKRCLFLVSLVQANILLPKEVNKSKNFFLNSDFSCLSSH